MAKKQSSTLTADDCIAALRELYKPPAFAFLEQVGSSTGWANKGWADAFAMSLWPSRGLDFIGFEVKVSRKDWKKELDSPAKADKIAKYCDSWWIVTPVGLIDHSELPKTWGLIEVSEKLRAKPVVEPPPMTPLSMTREFLAAILRRQSDAWREAMQRARYEGKEAGARDGHGELATALERARSRVEHLEQQISEFTKAAGVDILWRGGEIGAAVKTVLDAQYRQTTLQRLKFEMEAVARLQKDLKTEIAAIEALEARSPPGISD